MSDEKTERREPIGKALRLQVWETYVGDHIYGECYVCRCPIKIDNYECAHRLADVKGGHATLDNLRPTCRTCNRSCADRHLDEFRTQFKMSKWQRLGACLTRCCW